MSETAVLLLGSTDVEMEEGTPQAGGRPAKKVRHGELQPCLLPSLFTLSLIFAYYTRKCGS